MTRNQPAPPAPLFDPPRENRETIVTLRLTSTQTTALDAAAEQAGVDRSTLQRMALDYWIQNHPVTPRSPKSPKQPKAPKKARK